MHVETLDLNGFIAISRQLADVVEKKYGKWQVVVGIASGGQWVAKAFERDGVESVIVDNHKRKTTNWKRRFADGIISMLPTWLCNQLRIWELKATKKRIEDGEPPFYRLPLDIEQRLTEIKSTTPDEEHPLVVVVDDAADTGFTLKNVSSRVKEAMPNCKVVSAVITETLSMADSATDISVFKNGTILRFPWAPDASRAVRKDFENWKHANG